MCAVVINGSQIWTVERDDEDPQEQRKDEEMNVVTCLPPYHAWQFRLCFQLLCYSSLPYSSPGGFHSVVIITKVTMPEWGQQTESPIFLTILTFDIYTFLQFYICSRFIASLLCLVKY